MPPSASENPWNRKVLRPNQEEAFPSDKIDEFENAKPERGVELLKERTKRNRKRKKKDK